MLLLTSMLVARPAKADQLMSDADRNFDSYPIGTAPDINQPLGGWQFPIALSQQWFGDVRERYKSQFSIVDTSNIDPTREGHSLAIYERTSGNTQQFTALQYVLDPIIPEGSDGFVRLKFEAYVPDAVGREYGGVLDLSGDHGFGGVSTQTD